MKHPRLHAFGTLVRIRIRRQDALEQTRVAAQQELSRLIEAAEASMVSLRTADDKVTHQIGLIDELTRPGSRFQVADYLAQLDYRSSLEEQAAAARAAMSQADAAVERQRQTVQAARVAAAANQRQRERLEEKIKDIRKALAIRQMDDEDEEAEEAVVTRKLIKLARASQEAAAQHA